VQSLHRDYDRAILLIVEPGNQSVAESIVDTLALAARQRISGLQRVVNDDDVAASAGQRPVDRSCKAISP
jgi:hypothetical protein